MQMTSSNKEDKDSPYITTLPCLSQQIKTPNDCKTNPIPSNTTNPLSYSNPSHLHTYRTMNSANTVSTPQISHRQFNLPSSTIEIDKDKLYETFVLFQYFRNMTQTPQMWNEVSNPNSGRGIGNLQDKIDMINLTQSPNQNQHQHQQGTDSNYTSPLPHEEKNEKKYYDDRPIKCNNVNFRDLVEQILANDTINNEGITPGVSSSSNKGNNEGLNIQLPAKKTVKKSKTKDPLHTNTHKQNRTYQRPFYSTNITEKNAQRRKEGSSMKKAMTLYKKGEGFSEKEYNPQGKRVISNMKYDNITKSLRKSNTDIHPYMAALTQENEPLISNNDYKEIECSNARLTTGVNCNTLKEEAQVIHVKKAEKAIKTIDTNDKIKNKGNGQLPSENNEKTLTQIITNEEDKQKKINDDNNNEEEEKRQKSNDNDIIEHNNNIPLIYTHMKKEESFPIITDLNTINNDDDNNNNNNSNEPHQHDPKAISDEIFSNDEDEQIYSHPPITINSPSSSKNNNHQSHRNSKQDPKPTSPNQPKPQPSNISTLSHLKQTPSLEVEPIQSNTIPISTKLFSQIIPTQAASEKYIEKEEELHQEILIFQEERRKVTSLKEEYEKLHHRLESELDELTIHKTQFSKWREEETKRIQKEKKQNDQYKKIIAELRRENQLLRLNESNYKSQIDVLTHRLKEIEKEIKEKECMRQLNLTNKTSIQLGGDLSPVANTLGNRYIIGNNKQIKPPNTLYQSHNTSHGYTLNHSNRNANHKPKIPKEMSFTAYTNTITSNTSNTPNLSASLGLYTANSAINSSSINRKSVTKPNLRKTIIKESKKEETYDFIIPEEYLNRQYDLIKQEKTAEGKEIKWFNNDKREIIFTSGVRKEIYSDGYQIVSFPNGDMKQIYPNGKTVYYFKEASTVQTSYDDGLQVFKFNNGQIEKHFTDGKKEIYFPDKSYRLIRVDGSEETFYSDGTVQRIDLNNVVTIEHEDDINST